MKDEEKNDDTLCFGIRIRNGVNVYTIIAETTER